MPWEIEAPCGPEDVRQYPNRIDAPRLEKSGQDSPAWQGGPSSTVKSRARRLGVFWDTSHTVESLRAESGGVAMYLRPPCSSNITDRVDFDGPV